MHVYSVTPESASQQREFEQDYLSRLREAGAACERAGWSGILVPHNLHEVDPWLIAGQLGAATDTLVPLIAVQPSSLPPHTAAAMAAAYATLYGRPLHFNLVAGARDDELRRTGDQLGHDERYERMREYGLVLRALLRGEEVDTEGRFYSYRKFRLEPRPEVLSQCKLFVAGSSPASIGVARDIADVVVTHPARYPEWEETFLKPLLAGGYTGELGIRIGIVAGSAREDAWATARERFPETWQGRQETLLKTVSQNSWSRQLAVDAVAEAAEEKEPAADAEPDVYWLGAFRSGQASAPFLVGSHEDVGSRLAEYLRAGVRHVLLNGSYEDDHEDINRALLAARRSAGS
ncbi:LLM class flavin-dependent oxidoreductase [Kitasatospora purpeofusca]|uniref:LLM class flavin-dependent oxidoreductase n=1 Tax=Kitasatospora purpeofusca TaxID=67352 RepID=A0ABZ1U902_9ACTN|nr:LLM class flavin-dependent oxidoreductase [Kitasatospora purpeofusca]